MNQPASPDNNVQHWQSTRSSAKTLLAWLNSRVAPENAEWLRLQIEKSGSSNSLHDLYITLGMLPRKLPRIEMNLSAAESAEAERCYAGWQPSRWSIDTAARIAVLCSLAESNSDRFNDILAGLFRNADLSEQIAYYAGIALYPQSDALDWQVSEGLRSNIKAVFETIAHHNPYPALYFDESRWNHMVLKALFVDSTLSPIVGLDQRANHELAVMLVDYAHERQAAGRPVSPELWRCVGPFATGSMVDDLIGVIRSDDPLQQKAGALALSRCQEKSAAFAMSEYPELAAAISEGRLTWDKIAE